MNICVPKNVVNTLFMIAKDWGKAQMCLNISKDKFLNIHKIKLRRGGKNTQNYTKKDLNDPDNHDGVISHLEPDILECEVKWAFRSITTKKASGGDEIPA